MEEVEDKEEEHHYCHHSDWCINFVHACSFRLINL